MTDPPCGCWDSNPSLLLEQSCLNHRVTLQPPPLYLKASTSLKVTRQFQNSNLNLGRVTYTYNTGTCEAEGESLGSKPAWATY